MIPPAVIAGGAQLVGGILGGNKRAGEARVARRAVDARMVEAVEYAKRMNRKSGGSGYDFVALRNDALKAGFNPLSVLQATGGAGYDTRTIASPFGDVSSLMVQRAQMLGQMSGAVIETAGYLGDAISAGASAYFGQKNIDTANALDVARTAAISGLNPSQGGGVGGTVGRSPFGGAPVVQGGNSFSLPKEWWKPAKDAVLGLADRDFFTRFTGWGQTLVVPEGIDAESVLSGMWQAATLKAKAEGYIEPDAEREFFDRAIDIGSRMYQTAGWASNYLRRMGALPTW